MRNGNRTSKSTNGVTDYYGVDAANKLLWVNQGTERRPTSGQANPYTLFSYDLNGNMTSRERKYAAPYAGLTRHYTFAWDGDDRLRLAQESGSTRLQANYDGDGVRVYKADTWTSAHNYTWGPRPDAPRQQQRPPDNPGCAPHASPICPTHPPSLPATRR